MKWDERSLKKGTMNKKGRKKIETKGRKKSKKEL